MLRTTKEVEEEKKKILTLAMASGVEHGANKMALTATKLLLGEVFLGWLMIWGMLPTHTYRERWLPMLLSKMKTTYFGRLGTNLPILFIAVVGCVYLHIVQKSGCDKRRRRVTGYKRTDPVSHCRYHFINLITTFSRIRHRMFELFFYSHQLYILFLIFYLLHVGISFFYLVLPGVYLFMVDRFLRFLQSRNKVRLVSARLLPSETVELNFSMDPSFHYTPLSILFINVPSIYLIASAVSCNINLESDRLSIIIKKEGSWTEKLCRKVSSSSLDRLEVSVEGPYGPNAMDFLRCVHEFIQKSRHDLISCSCLQVRFYRNAVLWNKKSSTMKAKIQNTEALTDRELESVPHQFIVGATTFCACRDATGKRGLQPRSSLRLALASICSSGRSKSLHFEVDKLQLGDTCVFKTA
ncbi:hypothetical protein OPV22_030322 [Ensete ventricosum]|uniref:FAD-binding FR-type domain-containing protein n=1 Tax=Ensete ventricosum TaxID=4639 RepID=A0AAV8Q8N6_ENSVE|nr:hypothetical protein OPV22_030322 [Ensete ventricosum]